MTDGSCFLNKVLFWCLVIFQPSMTPFRNMKCLDKTNNFVNWLDLGSSRVTPVQSEFHGVIPISFILIETKENKSKVRLIMVTYSES